MLSVVFAASLVLLGLGVLGAVLRRGVPLYLGCAAACAAALLAAALFLAEPGAAPERLLLPVGLPWLPVHLRLDALSAFFLVIVDGLALIASIYAVGYGRHEAEPARVLPFYPAFLAGMNLALLADDAFAFLLSWEFMSLASWLLVLASHREAETRRAAYIYLVMAAFGTAALMLGFGVLAGPAGGYDFDGMRARELGLWPASLVAFLALVGAGSKAGLAPLHVWLPLAHPAAPSHVSALMSGAMTKVAVYALLRVLFDLLGEVVWWWGLVFLLVGGGTALLGVLFATVQRDLKTLLASSTVENLGIITVALGLAIAFKADGLPLLAAVALVAGLFHALNHAIFKGLLFLGAGAVLTATGTRDLERLGGLVHRMPHTALAFLIGCAAIAAIPPLNGFSSEWLVFQSVIEGAVLPQWSLQFAVPVVGALLALAAALAAAAFVRAFGIAFLGRPRAPETAAAREVDGTMRAAMGVLALLAILFGLVPGLALRLIGPVVQSLFGIGAINAAAGRFLWLTPPGRLDVAYSAFGLFAAGAVLLALTVLVVKRLSRRTPRRAPAWDCGFPDPHPATQYSASGFAQPIRRVFADSVFRAEERVDMPAPGERRPARLEVRFQDRAWTWIYAPLEAAVQWITERLNVLQFLTIRRHLSLMFGALVVLLAIIAVLR
jgi:formate hydrogenlyase subunit 3/multisubunit Na+/H+ antiporter MnhD subunit